MVNRKVENRCGDCRYFDTDKYLAVKKSVCYVKQVPDKYTGLKAAVEVKPRELACNEFRQKLDNK